MTVITTKWVSYVYIDQHWLVEQKIVFSFPWVFYLLLRLRIKSSKIRKIPRLNALHVVNIQQPLKIITFSTTSNPFYEPESFPFIGYFSSPNPYITLASFKAEIWQTLSLYSSPSFLDLTWPPSSSASYTVVSTLDAYCKPDPSKTQPSSSKFVEPLSSSFLQAAPPPLNTYLPSSTLSSKPAPFPFYT